ncbi:MAG: XRE family transcriptional regulator [Evtepia sp.]
MSRKPTKAAGNAFCIARMGAASFNDRLNSREGASELLGIDRTRLARIELGSLSPYPEEVLLMADGYNAPELLNHYCTSVCPIGCRSLQKYELNELDRLAVKLMVAFRKGESVENIFLDITEDGIIDETERPQLSHVIDYLDKITKTAGELKLWAEKNLA